MFLFKLSFKSGLQVVQTKKSLNQAARMGFPGGKSQPKWHQRGPIGQRLRGSWITDTCGEYLKEPNHCSWVTPRVKGRCTSSQAIWWWEESVTLKVVESPHQLWGANEIVNLRHFFCRKVALRRQFYLIEINCGICSCLWWELMLKGWVLITCNENGERENK